MAEHETGTAPDQADRQDAAAWFGFPPPTVPDETAIHLIKGTLMLHPGIEPTFEAYPCHARIKVVPGGQTPFFVGAEPLCEEPFEIFLMTPNFDERERLFLDPPAERRCKQCLAIANARGLRVIDSATVDERTRD
jgi:hypothetical protein